VCCSQTQTEENNSVKTNYKLTLAAVAGASISLAAAQVIGAQQSKVPPAYVIAEIEKDPTKIEDPAASRKYAEEAPKSLAAFQAQYLVRGGKVQTLEGEAPKGYIVVIGFESVEKARGWYDAPPYQAIKHIRQSSTKSRILIVEGVTAQ
jgi:uncharacterized protein (DUF1330 family)